MKVDVNMSESYQKSGNVTIIDQDVYLHGVIMPPCPGKGHNSTIINGKVYMNGYELINGEWKKTLKSWWYNLF